MIDRPRMIPTLLGTPITNDDGRRQGIYVARFRNIIDKHADFIRGFGFQAGSGSAEYPSHAHQTPGFGSAFKKTVATTTRRRSASPRSAKCCRAAKIVWRSSATTS